jgi:hypothetical protein
MARKYSRSASKEVKGAMRKRKRGNLKRGKGGKGGKVKSRKPGAPSSTNPQAGGGGAGYQAPRELPEACGAPNTQNPNPPRR